MRKQLTALLTALTLCLGAAPLTASAEEKTPPGSMLPDWVPRDYLSAVDFCNTYGKTRVQDGYICLVRRGLPDRDMHENFVETSSEQPIEQFIPQFVIGTKGDAPSDSPQQHYQFEVSLYQPSSTGELTITWDYKSAPDRNAAFTFDVAADGTITETDIRGWLPDSSAEFADFDKHNPAFSLHNGCIVYAGTPCYDGGYSELISIVGSGGLELFRSYHIGQLYAGDLPCGGSEQVIKVYRPVRAGSIQITASELCTWSKEPPVSRDTAYFSITDTDGQLRAETSAPPETLFGDCNGDGELNLTDLVSMHKYLHNQDSLTNPEAADLDGDGQVDCFDYANLQRLLRVQTPQKDGEVKFLSETVVNHAPQYEENHKAFDIKWYGNLDAVLYYINDFAKDYTVKLREITEETFQDHAVLAVASPIGSGDRKVTVESVERRGSQIIVHTVTQRSLTPTPDMAVIYTAIAVDKDAVEGIKDLVVENEDRYPENAAQTG